VNNKVLSLTGLCARAGKLQSGELPVEKAIKKGSGQLLIIAEDASENTKKKFRNMAEYRELPYLFYGDRETLGRAIGKEFRSVICITDEGFAGSIKKAFEQLG
jgi:ribosomal protein L7Ae-like RNA K-turn-binding protein